MKKRTIGFICALLVLIMLPMSVFASEPGSGNIDGGGGGFGEGTSQNSWNGGHDGARVTVIRDRDNAPVSASVDYTNIVPPSNMLSFNKISKLDYRNGAALVPSLNSYTYLTPDISLPRIINTVSQPASIEVIKRYFCSEYAAMMVARDTGIPYDDLTCGDYKLLLEPIAYFTLNGAKVGMTATEAALYDMQLGGDLRSKLPSLSHKNLPLAMFLEVSDLGYPAWSGSISSIVSNDQIIAALGLGIVRYREQPPDLEVETADYEYRTNTDVITAVTVSSGVNVTPDNPVSVTFTIMGSTYTVTDIVIPAGGNQIVWCKWRTPVTPQTVTILVTSSGSIAGSSIIRARIIDLNENPPPNPTARDRNDGFRIPVLPSNPQQTMANWSVWYCYWVANWEQCWHYNEDDEWFHWVDTGNWAYSQNIYSASLSASVKTMPDVKAATAVGKNMKSGYGITISVSAQVSTEAPTTHTTWAQNATSYFPEFSYNTYWRLHDRVVSGYNATLELRQNIYSTYNSRVHFLPVWYPNTTYTTYTYLIDAWTPVGMLSLNLNDYVNVNQSVFDDWHVAPQS